MDALNVVIVLDHAAVTGGQSKVAIDSALGLRQAGHRPIVFAGVGPVDPRLENAGIEVHCLGQSDLIGSGSRLGAGLQGLWNTAAAKALSEVLAPLPRKSTLVHVHGWAKALSPSIARPIIASGLPAVYTMHEYFLYCPNGGFYNYREGEICRLKPMSEACIASNCDSRHYAHKLWRVARQEVALHIAHLPQAFPDLIYLSAFEREIIAPFVPKDARLHHVANPVDAASLGHKIDPTAGEILFVGRLSAEKGTLIYAEAMERAGLRPVFIGDGPLETMLRSRFPHAKFLGWQRHDEVRRALRTARALVFPSLWYETFGLTVYEALAAGTPVVVSDGCAGREAVRDGQNGFWFRNGDVADLAEKLVLMRDDALVRALSPAAYDLYWAEPYSLDRHMKALAQVYDSVLRRAFAPADEPARRVA